MTALMKKTKKSNGRARSANTFPLGMRRWALIVAVMAVLSVGALRAARQPLATPGAQTALSTRQLSDVSLQPSARPQQPRSAKAMTADAAADAPSYAPAAESSANAAAGAAAPVTITGCLVRDDDTYWLKDASGTNVPTSRSWKSGFLKKRSSRIELVESNKALKMPTYVGQRVSATGTLANGEMKTRSLHRVDASCS